MGSMFISDMIAPRVKFLGVCTTFVFLLIPQSCIFMYAYAAMGITVPSP